MMHRTVQLPLLWTMIGMWEPLWPAGKAGRCIPGTTPPRAVDQTINEGINHGIKRVKKRPVARSIAVAVCCFLLCSPCHATTFIGILWPLFGPLAAPGLTEFVAELQAMPDVAVQTYWHTEWRSLVDDINQQPAGTHILVIGYSLGANNAVLVANNTNYIDSIVALQPSIFTHKTSLTGTVGRMVEIYNPNPLMTFGGMGSQRLEGPNIEYITNNDSHIGAPYDPQFRDLVRSEVARLGAEPDPDTPQGMPDAANATRSSDALPLRKRSPPN
jgi:hypothetical protein